MTGEIYRRWAAGLCMCCGADLNWYGQPETIAEDVQICGRCSENDHLGPSAPGLREAMLRALILRDDQPIEDLLPGSYIACRPA